jgi:hypothetical protein
VLNRCWAALYPRANFLDVLEGNPDLYGPFWIATTVVLILFLGGTISDYLARAGRGQFAYDFQLLSGRFSSLFLFEGEGGGVVGLLLSAPGYCAPDCCARCVKGKRLTHKQAPPG